MLIKLKRIPASVYVEAYVVSSDASCKLLVNALKNFTYTDIGTIFNKATLFGGNLNTSSNFKIHFQYLGEKYYVWSDDLKTVLDRYIAKVKYQQHIDKDNEQQNARAALPNNVLVFKSKINSMNVVCVKNKEDAQKFLNTFADFHGIEEAQYVDVSDEDSPKVSNIVKVTKFVFEE